MKRKGIVATLFFLLAVVYISLPLFIIHRKEAVLNKGQLFRFRIQPRDPTHIVKGKYLALRLKENKAPLPSGIKLTAGQKVYAILGEDKKKFAKIVRISLTPPKGDVYVRAVVTHVRGREVYLRFPFTHYYVEEFLAPKIEDIVRKYAREGKVYITVRVKRGEGVIEGLYISGKPILEFLKKK